MAAAKALKVGDPAHDETFLGPMIGPVRPRSPPPPPTISIRFPPNVLRPFIHIQPDCMHLSVLRSRRRMNVCLSYLTLLCFGIRLSVYLYLPLFVCSIDSLGSSSVDRARRIKNWVDEASSKGRVLTGGNLQGSRYGASVL